MGIESVCLILYAAFLLISIPVYFLSRNALGNAVPFKKVFVICSITDAVIMLLVYGCIKSNIFAVALLISAVSFLVFWLNFTQKTDMTVFVIGKKLWDTYKFHFEPTDEILLNMLSRGQLHYNVKINEEECLKVTGKMPTKQMHSEAFESPHKFSETAQIGVSFLYVKEMLNNSYIIAINSEEHPEKIVEKFSVLLEKHDVKLNINEKFKADESFKPRYALNCINKISEYISSYDYALISFPYMFWGMGFYAFSIVNKKQLDEIQSFKCNSRNEFKKNKAKRVRAEQ